MIASPSILDYVQERFRSRRRLPPPRFEPGDRVMAPATRRHVFPPRMVVGVIQPRKRLVDPDTGGKHDRPASIPIATRDASGEYLVFLIADDRHVFAAEFELEAL